jgi:sugar O-acyltransferase (sialic acid O-acetyltransferase NeuD family)
MHAARAAGSPEVVAVVDDNPALRGQDFEGAPIVGDKSELPRLRRAGIDAALLGIGSVDVTELRAELFSLVSAQRFAMPVVRHPTAIVLTEEIGEASVILPLAFVNVGARIGRNVIVNSGAIVEHDVVIEDHVHVATGAHIAGGVSIGSESHIGIGSTIIQGVRIGTRALVAAGAVVVADVPDGGRVGGVPARTLRRR